MARRVFYWLVVTFQNADLSPFVPQPHDDTVIHVDGVGIRVGKGDHHSALTNVRLIRTDNRFIEREAHISERIRKQSKACHVQRNLSACKGIESHKCEDESC